MKILARIALEHHEKMMDQVILFMLPVIRLDIGSQIVSVCNVYDNLTSNMGLMKINNSKEAIKIILEMGSSWFNAEVLYTFVHMANYNDQIVF